MKKLTLIVTTTCLAVAPLAASAGNLAAVGSDTAVIAPAPVAAAPSGALGGLGLGAAAAAALGTVALVAILAGDDDDDSSTTTTSD